jgi:Leucine-rich repeat (LRR) protein
LTLENPLGFDVFESIGGQHIGTRGDESVQFMVIDDQNARTIPSVICNQFQGLQRIFSTNSNLGELSATSFVDCGFLQEIVLTMNNFPVIPSNVFEGAPNLRSLILEMNSIREIQQNAFAGTQIQNLDLSHNRINTFDASIYVPIAEMLEILMLNANQLSELPIGAFDRLIHLRELSLSENYLTTIPVEVFSPLINLRTLHLVEIGVSDLQIEWFSSLFRLRTLELENNFIQELPENVFDLPNLVYLGLTNNRIQTLDANSFGRSLDSLENLAVQQNQIGAFDPHILSNATNLFSMWMEGNECVDVNFGEIQENLLVVSEYLYPCIFEYNNMDLSCEFWENEATYTCELTINNFWNRLRFENIMGEHLPGANDNFVTYINGKK